MAVRQGGFLDDVSGFDSAFFGVSPREALTMDPQQRLLLETCWHALEDAGMSPERTAGSATGVFVGICNSDHFQRVLEQGVEQIDAYLASGNAHSVAAGRISYCLGLQGPALSIDTACSSSLVALHEACRSLRAGESEMAIAAGVNVMCSPQTTVTLTKAHMLAPDGRCKTFDASADGFSRGEGCGVVVLKRLSDARRDGDRVLALVRGSAINQDGRSGGLTVPNGPAQEAVIRAALADAGLQPGDIDYVEAHGTGTTLGDPIEVRALAHALAAGRHPEAPLRIGSVKTNIGHLESAAGIAGVIKVVLSLQHEAIPPHLHFREPSPHIDWSFAPVEVTAKGSPWPRGARARRAGVSSFGFSGTNGHVVLEEAPSPEPQPAGAVERPQHCLPVSARSDAALRVLAAALAERLDAGEASLADRARGRCRAFALRRPRSRRGGGRRRRCPGAEGAEPRRPASGTLQWRGRARPDARGGVHVHRAGLAVSGHEPRALRHLADLPRRHRPLRHHPRTRCTRPQPADGAACRRCRRRCDPPDRLDPACAVRGRVRADAAVAFMGHRAGRGDRAFGGRVCGRLRGGRVHAGGRSHADGRTRAPDAGPAAGRHDGGRVRAGRGRAGGHRCRGGRGGHRSDQRTGQRGGVGREGRRRRIARPHGRAARRRAPSARLAGRALAVGGASAGRDAGLCGEGDDERATRAGGLEPHRWRAAARRRAGCVVLAAPPARARAVCRRAGPAPPGWVPRLSRGRPASDAGGAGAALRPNPTACA
ncbi:polyketide synthase [Piscinibacter aquaticus]|uniref:Polyketide synthase n=1 Tax=Piscinibacter aquaticus TaxID=392597 RepID=A0A5C6U2U7_9BURK|nr:polyketide synthase [Piscinibacter aquaticus]